MNRILTLCMVGLPLMIAGCTTPPRQSPAPVYRSSPPSAPASGSQTPVTESASPVDNGAVRTAPARETEVRAYEYAAPAATPAMPVQGAAVVALLDNADVQVRAGDLGAAAATLERALRIEPRNASLWSRLAALRLRQGRYGMAADLAAKSNSLAGSNRALKRDNWRLIARARRAAGDADGARAAQQRADQL